MKDGMAILKAFSPDAEQLLDICRRRHVRKLELFGSAASGEFDPETSDLDFLVVFEELDPIPYKNAYFSLLEDLKNLFHRPIDLLMPEAITNPYFLESIAPERVEVYGGRISEGALGSSLWCRRPACNFFIDAAGGTPAPQ
jgi:uncharacterized protein